MTEFVPNKSVAMQNANIVQDALFNLVHSSINIVTA
jgi:hypothetical protein